MDEEWTFSEAVKLARAFLNKQRSALQTAVSITRLGLAHLSCWDALGGANGPLSALYGADDDADKQYFLGDDVEKWHPSVIEEKRAALADAELFWAADVRAACEALVAYAAKQKGT
jgi:hypothetical protein